MNDINFYWFGRHTNQSLEDISDILEDSGFYGWLLPYATGLPDQFIRVARSINLNQKLKYLIAVRPYNISPQYLCSISKSLDLIQKDRVRINFVPGLIDNDFEKFFGGVINETNDTSNFFDRKKYFCSYIKSFNELPTDRPYVYVSGLEDEFCPDMSKYSDANIVSYGRLVDGTLDKSDKTKIIFVPINNIQDLYDKIEDIKNFGYKNIMIHVHGDEMFSLALEIFKEIKKIKITI